MYRLNQFGGMIRDRVRMDAYVEALRRAVKPGDVVIDIGTGTGIFALIACQLGAKHVYAYEPNPLIKLGAPMAAANGFADRITFIQDFTTHVTPPELADVIVGDIRGRLPFLQPNIATYHDAYTRLLKPGGILIPQRDRLYAAFLTQAELYRNLVTIPWLDNPYQLDMSAAHPFAVNALVGNIDHDKINVALPGKHWETLDYGIRTTASASGVLEWDIDTAATLHFIYVWFDADLIEGVGYSSAPDAPIRPEVYGHTLFPLETPLEVQQGQRLRLQFYADPLGDDYIYRWNTALYASASAASPLKRFTQSSFFAQPLLGIHKRSPTFTPSLSAPGRLTAFILGRMAQGGAPLSDIAHAALEQFPDSGHDYRAMLSLVADLSQSFSH